MDKASSVDEYLQLIPEDQRALLSTVRDEVHRQVPGVEETISYQMPTFKLRGHTKGSLHFTTAQPIPPDVLEAIIHDRLADHEAGGY